MLAYEIGRYLTKDVEADWTDRKSTIPGESKEANNIHGVMHRDPSEAVLEL